MAGMTPEQILAVLGQSRTKGEYAGYLKDFLESGEAGVSVNDTWPALSQKKATTVKQGFENAKDKKDAPEGAENIKIVKSNDQVYLFNLSLVELPAGMTEDAS